jgi:hypothetical protein
MWWMLIAVVVQAKRSGPYDRLHLSFIVFLDIRFLEIFHSLVLISCGLPSHLYSPLAIMVFCYLQ